MDLSFYNKLKETFDSNKIIQSALENKNFHVLFLELLNEKEKANFVSTKTVSHYLKRISNGSNMELKMDLEKLKTIVEKKLEIISLVEEFEKNYVKEKEDYWF